MALVQHRPKRSADSEARNNPYGITPLHSADEGRQQYSLYMRKRRDTAERISCREENGESVRRCGRIRKVWREEQRYDRMGERRRQEKWVVTAKGADFQAIAQRFQIDPVTARIIRNRGIVGDEAIRQYLYGSTADLHAPELMKGCAEAAELLRTKISQGRRIRIIGDYDIDGVNATYILYRAILRCGGTADYEIPDRMKDGYGLNLHLLELAVQEGIDTVITCDNGIAAIKEIEYAKQCGLTVIVTDHHEPLYEEAEATCGGESGRARQGDGAPGGRRYLLPAADVLVNPKQPGCGYPFKKLCGAAVAWKVVCALYRLFGIGAREAEEFLPFAAFATVGDVMDLEGENRILVKEGLKRIPGTDNLGLLALIRANGLDPAHISAYHIGFVLGPCINASGRLDTARRSVRLLLAKTREEADELAGRLKELNDERKALTQNAVDEACALIDSGAFGDDRVLVVYLPDCHESIAGIVAGKVRERYCRPVFVVTDAQEGAKGSGRSIEAYSMFDEMVKCADLFLKYGGHPMAAGFSLPRERIGEMRRRLNENCTLTEQDMTEKIAIDVPMPIDYITQSLVDGFEALEPFGKGNEKPLFAEAGLQLLSARVLGKNGNVLKFRVMNRAGCMMDALYFGDPGEVRTYLEERYGEQRVRELYWGRGEGLTLDVIYYPSVNEYLGQKSLQIVIRHYR